MNAIAEKTKRPRKVPPTAIRSDYQQEEWWTISEAADFAGKCRGVVNNWIREKKFTSRSAFTAYRVYAAEFIRFIETGEPQISSPESNPTT